MEAKQTDQGFVDAAAIIQYIMETFENVQVETGQGNSFFYVGAERNLPFATLVTNDAYDTVSSLSRPSIYRLNIGISKPTFLGLFGAQPARQGASGVIETGHYFAALDEIMPHPIYGNMWWICVLNPSPATFEQVRALLAEAHAQAAARHSKGAPRGDA